MALPPKVCVTCDILVFTGAGDERRILLIKRAHPPFKGRWALPGGFIELDETLEESALRELEEETGVRGVKLHQLGTWGDPGRDPRGRTVSVAYWTVVKRADVKAGDDAADAQWHSVNDLPPLAFDHGDMIRAALPQVKS